MKKLMLVIGLVLLGALAFAACGGDDNGDTEAVGDGNLPPVSDDAQDPGPVGYRVMVSFNEESVQADVDEIGRLLAGYDDGVDFMIQESFPPIGVASLSADPEGFCDTIVPVLEAETFVATASCGPQLEPGDPGFDDGAQTSLGCEEGATDCDDIPFDTEFGDTGTNGSDGDEPGIVSSPVCAPGFPDCEDTVVTNDEGEPITGHGEVGPADPPLPADPLPLAPDDMVVPPGQFQLTVRFNTTVEQTDMDEVGARVRDFDPDAQYVIQESWPPIGVAQFVAETEDVCLALSQDLEDETFVTSSSCGPWLEPGDPIDPDEPAVNDLE